ncbi:organ-specific protein S2-like [Andrographis paniculata]|uniref:organ-specific protein S2-like n=1 Tax=Andrographis paniculata TaxID=175694 RepID=UPI0021E8B7DF|nr:organ-specific protein S2-like [Andrographis paniculata]
MNKKTLCLLFLSLMLATTYVVGARIHRNGKSIHNTKSEECHNSGKAKSMHIDHFKAHEKELFLKDFDPRPSVTAYVDNQNPEKKNPFVTDFEPRSTYVGNKKFQNKILFWENIEPRPSVTAYVDNLKSQEKKPSTKDFESEPNGATYMEDIKAGADKKVFQGDFEPRPSVTAYLD